MAAAINEEDVLEEDIEGLEESVAALDDVIATEAEVDADPESTASGEMGEFEEVGESEEPVEAVETEQDHAADEGDGSYDAAAEDAFMAATKKTPGQADVDQAAAVDGAGGEALSDADDVLADELNQVENGPTVQEQAATEEETAVAPGSYDHLPAGQRGVIKGFEVANKPFEKVVPDTAIDTIGLVAVVTVMVAMVTTALVLLWKF